MDESEYWLEETFTKGPGIHFDPDAVLEGVQLSKNLIGLWQCESDPSLRFTFLKTGKVNSRIFFQKYLKSLTHTPIYKL